MTELYKNFLEATLEYGQGYDQQVGGAADEVTTNYDFAANSKPEEIIDYHIHEIIYTLNEKQIQTLKIIYKNRNDGNLKTLLDTISSHKDHETEESIKFEDAEEICEVFFYISKERIAAISMKTNLGNTKIIGNTSNGELVKDENLKDEKNVIFGFGVHAGQKFGVSSIYCYYMSKKKYGIVVYSGLLQLRAKLKVNKEFRDKLKTKRESLNEKQKLVLDTCDLPDTAFFPFASYIMTY